jgi:hypothetical protein
MTAATAISPPSGSARAGLRLAWLHLMSRRMPVAVAAIVACGVLLRIALLRDWNAYGALQLPLIFETGCAVVIGVATTSPFGESERVTGRWLPFLRMGTALTLTIAAVGALSAAGIGADLGGGALDVLRNLAGMIGLGLLCAAVFGGSLAWTAPTAYLVVAIYALYTQWHGPALSTPWIWPARPSHDVGAAVCAALVFTAGLAAVALRGARDPLNDRNM